MAPTTEDEKRQYEQELLASTTLSEDDRRRIKRRASNRESARRTRMKRTERLRELELRHSMLSMETAKVSTCKQALERLWHEERVTNAGLQREIQLLRASRPQLNALVPSTQLAGVRVPPAQVYPPDACMNPGMEVSMQSLRAAVDAHLAGISGMHSNSGMPWMQEDAAGLGIEARGHSPTSGVPQPNELPGQHAAVSQSVLQLSPKPGLPQYMTGYHAPGHAAHGLPMAASPGIPSGSRDTAASGTGVPVGYARPLAELPNDGSATVATNLTGLRPSTNLCMAWALIRDIPNSDLIRGKHCMFLPVYVPLVASTMSHTFELACAGNLNSVPVHATNLLSVIGHSHGSSASAHGMAAPEGFLAHHHAHLGQLSAYQVVGGQVADMPESRSEFEAAGDAQLPQACPVSGATTVQISSMPTSMGVPVSLPQYSGVPPAIPPPQDPCGEGQGHPASYA